MAYLARGPQSPSSSAAVRIVNPAEQSDDQKPLPKRGMSTSYYSSIHTQTSLQNPPNASVEIFSFTGNILSSAVLRPLILD